MSTIERIHGEIEPPKNLAPNLDPTQVEICAYEFWQDENFDQLFLCV